MVYDAIIDDDRSKNAFGLLMSLNMLIETPAGFDYTGAECVGWMKEAGFREVRGASCGPGLDGHRHQIIGRQPLRLLLAYCRDDSELKACPYILVLSQLGEREPFPKMDSTNCDGRCIWHTH